MKTTRRTAIAAGTAWAVPTILGAHAAPAFAVSPSCDGICPKGDFGGALNTNGWSLKTAGTFSQGVNQRLGYYASYTPWSGTSACTGATGGSAGGTLQKVIVGEADPTSAGSTLDYRVAFCLKAGVTYTFKFDWNSYNINSRSSSLTARVLTVGGTVLAQSGTVTAAASTANARGSQTFSFTPSATDVYIFSYLWTFGTSPSTYTGCELFANDIAVTAPVVTCTPMP